MGDILDRISRLEGLLRRKFFGVPFSNLTVRARSHRIVFGWTGERIVLEKRTDLPVPTEIEIGKALDAFEEDLRKAFESAGVED